MKAVLFIALALITAGCVSQTTNVGGGLVIQMTADPSQVFSLGETTVHIDLENSNPRKITDVEYSIFDAGRLLISDAPGSECTGKMPFMLPDQIKSSSCLMEAPSIQENSVSSEINMLARYKTEFPVVQVIDMISEDEYLVRRAIKEIEMRPSSYSYRDSNIQVDVEFSEQLPLVIREGKEYFVYFTVRNIGNGMVESLGSGDFIVLPARQGSPNVVECPSIDQNWKIEPEGKIFPRIACRIIMPEGVEVVENYGLLVLLNYKYEIRKSVSVEIIK